METAPQPDEGIPISKSTEVKPPGFWQRQFIPEVTTPQIVFDVIAGIAAPILCLIFDPLVFRMGWLFGCTGQGWLGQYRVFAYLAIGLGILSLSLWLIVGKRMKQWVSFLGGIFLAGTLFSFVLGVKIALLSLLGLLLVLFRSPVGIIGILGFTPFLTAFVYLRNGARAIRITIASFEGQKLWLVAGVLAGIIVVLGVPALVQWQMDRIVFQAIEEVLGSGSTSAQQSARILKNFCSVCPDCYLQYTVRYLNADGISSSGMPETNDRLDAIYREATGQNVPECDTWPPD